MPVIRISTKTLERLKKWAEPLTDTAESALVKVLDAADNESLSAANSGAPDPDRPAMRPGRGDRLTLAELRQPLMETIYEMGGSVRAGALRPVLRSACLGRLSAADLEPSHRVRNDGGTPPAGSATSWWSRACSGVIPSAATWALSETGVSLAETSPRAGSTSFIDHLLALPDVGDDADFDQPRSGPRPVECEVSPGHQCGFRVAQRERANRFVTAWFRERKPRAYLSVLTLGELRRGAERVSRRDPRSAAFSAWLDRTVPVPESYRQRRWRGGGSMGADRRRRLLAGRRWSSRRHRAGARNDRRDADVRHIAPLEHRI